MILIVYGTRPEYLKVKPIINELEKRKISYGILFTGQHTDLLQHTDPNHILKIKEQSNRLNSIITSCLTQINESIFDKYEYVLVQGDTTSVLAVALTAFNHNKKVIHLEAGLRTYDKNNPYPEETNRRIVSLLSDIHLCPTNQSKQNLINEKIEGEIYVVGNTVLDNLIPYKDNCEYTNTVLITLHRRENHHWMKDWFIAINNIAKNHTDLNFVFPIHPNPNVQKYKNIINAKNIKVIEPLNHNDLLNILIKTKIVITDSGGIQEECSFFNKKCLVCRKITERPEVVNHSSFIVSTPYDLEYIFNEHINNYHINIACPYGDGYSSKKIIDILTND